jgi:DNA-binding CsgD family transcriptional regulator
MSVEANPISVSEMDPQVDFLRRIDLRMQRRNQRMSANLLAWMGVMDALGWNVALFLPGQAPILSPRAREWALERPEPEVERDGILARLAVLPPPCRLVDSAQLQIWSEGGPEGHAFVEPALSAPLTKREAEVLDWLREGKTGPEIAIILGCALRTVESHVARLYRKIGVRRRTQLHFNTGMVVR